MILFIDEMVRTEKNCEPTGLTLALLGRYGDESRAGDAAAFPPSPVVCAARGPNGGGEAGGQFPPPNSSSAPRPPPAEGVKKKKPFHCKPCHFQADGEEDFVEHLRTHALSKMAVVHRVEGRSKAKEAEAAPGGEGEAASGDAKGLIRCERCGYNTNRYDHYVAHLKHHSKEGDDHRSAAAPASRASVWPRP